MSCPRLFSAWFVAGTALAALSGFLASPTALRAQKLPVDCSGSKSDCYTHRFCADWVSNERCREFHTEIWRWYR